MNEDKFTRQAEAITASRRAYNDAHNAGDIDGMRRHGQALGIDEGLHLPVVPDSPRTAALRAALSSIVPQRVMNDGSPVSSPRSSQSSPKFMPPVETANSRQNGSKPAWNSSTRIEQPMSETATRLSTHANSTSMTGKIGSKHWK